MNAFLSPGMLMVAVPAILVVALIAARSRSGLAWPRMLAAGALRAALALGLIAALARPADMDERIEPRALVVLFDVSDSVPASARRAGVDHLKGVLASLAAEPGLTVSIVPFAGAPFPLGPAHAFDEASRAVLLWDSEGRKLRRELDALREASSPPPPGGRREALEAVVTRLDEALATLDTSRTDLARAVAFATGVDPAAGSRALLLYSDGRWDPAAGSPWAAAARAFERVRVVQLHAPDDLDLVAEELRLPLRVRSGEPFDARVALAYTGRGKALVQLLIDGKPSEAREIVFPAPGRQEIVFPDLTLAEGLHRVQAVARLAEGEEEETRNNVLYGAVDAVGRPRAALVEGAPQSSGNLARALEAQDFEVVRVPRAEFPSRQEGLQDFQAVVLTEPAAGTLTPAQVGTLEDWVSDGGGLFVVTGVDGKALAGVRGSPLARLLPVKIPDPDKAPPKPDEKPPDPEPNPEPEKKDPVAAQVELPTIALVLAIDKSGSMSGDKMLLAKEAVIASAKLLRPNDLVGVIAFDGSPRWAVSVGDASRIDYITDRVSRLRPEGGTDVFPALLMAYRELRTIDAQAKHVIVLTDGYTPLNDFSGLLEQMVKEKITVSTVGVGTEFDGQLLTYIATWGQGRYYFTKTVDEVPALFLRETRRVAKLKDPSEAKPPDREPDHASAANPEGGKTPEGEKHEPDRAGPEPGEEAAPVAGPERVVAPTAGPLTEGLDVAALPRFEKYAVTELRRQGSAPFVTEGTKRPGLAFWRFGLGRVMVWTSDLRERGAPAWVRWEPLPKFAARAVRFIASVKEDARVDVEYALRPGTERDTIELAWTYPAMSLGGATPAVASAATVEPSAPLAVRRSGPASFALDVPVPKTGVLVPVLVRHVTADGHESAHRFGVARSYPEELRDRRADPEGTAKLAAVLRAVGEGSLVAPARPARRYREKGPDLILVLVFVFFVETVIRKLRR